MRLGPIGCRTFEPHTPNEMIVGLPFSTSGARDIHVISPFGPRCLPESNGPTKRCQAHSTVRAPLSSDRVSCRLSLLLCVSLLLWSLPPSRPCSLVRFVHVARARREGKGEREGAAAAATKPHPPTSDDAATNGRHSHQVRGDATRRRVACPGGRSVWQASACM